MAAGCGLASVATPTPEPMPVVVRVLATDLAYELAVDLATAYNPTRREAVVVVEPAPVDTARDSALSGVANLALLATHGDEGFQTPVASVALTPVGHPTNPVRDLTREQLRLIQIGDARDWGLFGGVPGPIQVVSPNPGSDAATQLDLMLGASGQLTADALFAPTWEAMGQLVPQFPGAIGYLPAHRIDRDVVALAEPVPVLVVALAASEPGEAAREFLTWVQSDVGQQVVARRFEPIP
jgi:phosphate transport system substrate-binding protein